MRGGPRPAAGISATAMSTTFPHSGHRVGSVPVSRARSSVQSALSKGRWRFGRCRSERLAAPRERLVAIPVGEEAVGADPHEAVRQDVEQEAAEKLVGVQAHRALPVAVGSVAPREDDLLAFEAQETVVGNRNRSLRPVLHGRPEVATAPGVTGGGAASGGVPRRSQSAAEGHPAPLPSNLPAKRSSTSAREPTTENLREGVDLPTFRPVESGKRRKGGLAPETHRERTEPAKSRPHRTWPGSRVGSRADQKHRGGHDSGLHPTAAPSPTQGDTAMRQRDDEFTRHPSTPPSGGSSGPPTDTHEPPNAFDRDFLETFSRREPAPATPEADNAGPWRVTRLHGAGDPRWACIAAGERPPRFSFREPDVAFLTSAGLTLADRPARFKFLRDAEGTLHLMFDGWPVGTAPAGERAAPGRPHRAGRPAGAAGGARPLPAGGAGRGAAALRGDPGPDGAGGRVRTRGARRPAHLGRRGGRPLHAGVKR